MARHGLGKPKTYSHWYNMKTRCFNKNNIKYKDYGGRGITVFKEWIEFKNFHFWAIANGFKEGLSLERVDVNGNYCPENCTWITMAEQAKNKRNVILYTYNGLTMHAADWGKYLKLGKETVRNRIKNGWSLERALQPIIKGGD